MAQQQQQAQRYISQRQVTYEIGEINEGRTYSVDVAPPQVVHSESLSELDDDKEHGFVLGHPGREFERRFKGIPPFGEVDESFKVLHPFMLLTSDNRLLKKTA